MSSTFFPEITNVSKMNEKAEKTAEKQSLYDDGGLNVELFAPKQLMFPVLQSREEVG